LATFVMKESAYLLNFGYQGIMSTIDALVTKKWCDCMTMLMLALLMVFVCTWKRFTYRHNDLASMEKNLSVLLN
jgi:glycine C-acetyltransferase